MHDTDPWPGTLDTPDWTAEAKVQFDPGNPDKTIPLSWAVELIQRQYKANPASFSNKLASVVSDWAAKSYGQGGSD